MCPSSVFEDLQATPCTLPSCTSAQAEQGECTSASNAHAFAEHAEQSAKRVKVCGGHASDRKPS